jgi:hypothetical protein
VNNSIRENYGDFTISRDHAERSKSCGVVGRGEIGVVVITNYQLIPDCPIQDRGTESREKGVMTIDGERMGTVLRIAMCETTPSYRINLYALSKKGGITNGNQNMR